MTSGWPFARACRWEELVDQCRLQRRPLSRSAPVSSLITITFEFQKQISSSSLGFHSARFLSLVCSKERHWCGCAHARPAAARRLCPWAGLKLIHPNCSCVGSVRPVRVREAVSGMWLCTPLFKSSYCIKTRLLIWSVLQEVSEPPRSHFSSPSSSPYVFLTSFKKLVIMADYIICNFFLSPLMPVPAVLM